MNELGFAMLFSLLLSYMIIIMNHHILQYPTQSSLPPLSLLLLLTPLLPHHPPYPPTTPRQSIDVITTAHTPTTPTPPTPTHPPTTPRQSIDVIAWHPAGHCVGTASHDGILKFWSREPPGSTLEQEAKEFQDNPNFAHGPLEVMRLVL